MGIEMKKLLIPNGSFHEIPLIKKAKEMGYYVIASGTASQQIGYQYADEYVYGDFSNKELMLDIALDKKINFICSNCNDFGYLSACYVADKMGLPGHEPYETAVTLHHKDKFKKMSKHLGLSSPVAESFSDARSAKQWIKDVVYPIIIKPTDLGAGQGITRVDTCEQATAAIDMAIELSKEKMMVIEPFIEGTSHSFNAFILNKKVTSYYSDNEYMVFDSYRVSTSASPADRINEAEHLLIEQTEIVAQELNLPDGLLHSQYIMGKDGKPYILEITRRMSGDWYAYPQIRATGIDWIGYSLKAQLGIDCSDFPKGIKQKGFTGRHCLNGRKIGIIKNISIEEQLKKYVYDSVLWLNKGYKINNPKKDYPGILFFEFPNKKEMIDTILHIEDFIHLEYQ